MTKQLNILLIEDSQSDADLIVRHLEKSSYSVSFERVESVEELNKALATQSWNIVFSDYKLPGLDALEALEIFKSYNLVIPFIIISGTIGEEAAVNLIKSGAQNYVMKSNLAKLASVVAQELEEASERREQVKGSGNFFKLNLQYLLEKNAIKQSQLSREIGISKQTISDWLKKDSLINIQQALKVTKYFRITVEELLNSNLKNANEITKFQDSDFSKKIQTPFWVMSFDGSYTNANQAFSDLLGFSEYEINSRLLTELIHPEDVAHIQMLFRKANKNEDLFSQIKMRFMTAKSGFCWTSNLCIRSAVDKKIFIYSTLESDYEIEEILSEPIALKSFVVAELEKIQFNCITEKKLDFINEIDSKISISANRNVLKCILHSLFNQFQAIEFESKLKFEVLLKTRIENGKTFLSAIINCAINPNRLDLSRVQKIGNLINSEICENYAGDIYSFYIAFDKS